MSEGVCVINKAAVYMPESLACIMQLEDVLSHNNTGRRSGTW
ncbi:hypothetical protein [Candidatus Desulfovibrio trichonymphae]|nr:hypothetical protein [Candidatus Desulfovibrio trichonymphae]